MRIVISNNNMNHGSGGRMLSVSLLRVISMLMIVLFHCMFFNTGEWSVYPCTIPNEMTKSVASIIVSIALPLFFFISGFLFAYIYKYKNGYRDWKLFTWNKLKRLILPTFSWTIVYLIIFPFRYTVWEYLSGIRHLWFLPTLFVIFIIVRVCIPFLLAKRKPFKDVLLLLVLFIISNAVHIPYWSQFIGKFSYYISFFVGGVMFCKYWFALRNKTIEVVCILVLIGLHIINTAYLFFFSQLVMDTVVLIAICCLTFDLLSVVKIDSSMATHFLSNLDKNSLGIYLVHQVLIMALYQFTQFEESWLTYHPYIGPIMLFAVVFPLSWAFSDAKRRLRLEPFL